MRMKLPKHVHAFVDRHGKPRYYARRPGAKSVPLPGQPYSAEFMAAYEAAISGLVVERQIGSNRTLPGTVNAAVISYIHSPAWQQLSKGTQGARRAILERFREEHGDKRMGTLTARPLKVILESKKPNAARNWLKTLRGLCQHARNMGLLREDPTADIKLRPAPRIQGFHTWQEAEIERFEKCHAIGTKPRLAMALMLFTGQRRSDIVKLGRQHERGNELRIIQQKTGTELFVPIAPELRAIIDATPSQHLTYLVTEQGKPFTAAGFGNWFGDQVKAAGLPDVCRSHGLRKALCRRLAELGESAMTIASISGHKNTRQLEPYTEAANRTKMARAGMAALTRAFSSTKDENSHLQTQNKGLQTTGKNP